MHGTGQKKNGIVYVSVHHENVKTEVDKFKHLHKTMGPYGLQQKPGLENSTLKIDFKQERCTHERKPPVPKHNEKPVKLEKKPKYFVSQNIIETIQSKPGPHCVNLEDSGLSLKYSIKKSNRPKSEMEVCEKVPKVCLARIIKSHPDFLDNLFHFKGFGSVPKYLKNRMESQMKEQANQQSLEGDVNKANDQQKLEDNEKEELLEGLKTCREKLQHEFQSLSLVIDTPRKKWHKEHLESQLKQVETDIDLLQTHKNIFIST
ncbi:Enkurin [Nymphon striatum]|nr:Enkurin [Nymphon striatum]